MLAVAVRSEINNKKNTLEETNWLEPGKDANSNCRGHGRVRSFWKTEGLAGQCLMLLQVTWPEPLHLSLGTPQEEHPCPCLPRSLQWPLGAVLCVVNTGSQAWAECFLVRQGGIWCYGEDGFHIQVPGVGPSSTFDSSSLLIHIPREGSGSRPPK